MLKRRMTIHSKSLLFLLFFLFFCVWVEAQEVPTSRSFNTEKVEELKDEYSYELAPPGDEGAFERFWNRVVQWFWSLFESEVTSTILNIIFYGILLAALVFAVIKLAGVEVNSVFKNNLEVPSLEVNEENLNGIDFDQAINMAKSDQDWRLMIRLLYLKSLKSLWDKEIISVRKGKTNREYYYEIQGKSWSADFQKLSLLFDYTWYGHFEAKEVHAQKAIAYSDTIGIEKGGSSEG